MTFRKPQNQRGVSMIMTLLALAGMMIAAAGLMRSADTTTAVSGNISHHNLTANSNDWAIAQAQAWLLATRAGGGLNMSNEAMGYFSSSPPEPTDWTLADSWVGARDLGNDPSGNQHSVVIQRLCTQANTTYNGTNAGVNNQCALRYVTSNSARGNSAGFGAFQYDQEPQIFYRVMTRTTGSKGANAMSITTISVAN